jgi:hypothetical protein
MNQRIEIKPCSENWEKMTPTEQGRHCNKCDKVVHNVAQMSNEVVMQNWRDNNGDFCINIPKERAEPVFDKWYTKWKYTAATIILTAWLSAKQLVVKAQDQSIENANQAKDSTINSCRISGSVVDSLQNEEPLAYTYIQVTLPDSSIRGTYTDSLGNFSIYIDEEFNPTDTLSIVCNALGYEAVSIESRIKEVIEAEIYMSQNHICLKEAVIMVKREPSGIKGAMTGSTFRGVPLDRDGIIYKQEFFDSYDTKTFHSDEIERLNLGR